jgi:hypothetical protein
MNELFLAWQDPGRRSWFPIGKLSTDGDAYEFVYTKGALISGFQTLGQMADLHRRYRSTVLFPLFSNRLLSRRRPEYRSLLEWVNLSEGEDTPIQILARTEGVRGTDTLTVFPRPEPDKDGTYRVHFFSHGIQYLRQDSIEAINALQPGTRLFVLLDVQNEHDEFAIALRTDLPPMLVGYCPRYLARDFRQIIAPADDPGSVQVRIQRVNVDAPLQLRMLCTIEGVWPEGFEACTDDAYTPLA